MITLKDYWMGRDVKYPLNLTTDIRANATRTVALVDRLMTLASEHGVAFHKSPHTGTLVASGWRPPEVNGITPGAAANSKHMTGLAIDIYDPEGDFDEWLMSGVGQRYLAEIGLWMEHPSATKGWSHLQAVPPNSKRRVFYP